MQGDQQSQDAERSVIATMQGDQRSQDAERSVIARSTQKQQVKVAPTHKHKHTANA